MLNTFYRVEHYFFCIILILQENTLYLQPEKNADVAKW